MTSDLIERLRAGVTYGDGSPYPTRNLAITRANKDMAEAAAALSQSHAEQSEAVGVKALDHYDWEPEGKCRHCGDLKHAAASSCRVSSGHSFEATGRRLFILDGSEMAALHNAAGSYEAMAEACGNNLRACEIAEASLTTAIRERDELSRRLATAYQVKAELNDLANNERQKRVALEALVAKLEAKLAECQGRE